MTQLLIHNIYPLLNNAQPERGWILIEDARFAQIGTGDAPTFADAEMIDGGGKTALPGFIDLHVHGALGHDTMDATPEGLEAMSHFFATCGVTSLLPTTMTASESSIHRALENIALNTGPVENGATILGAHLEGPYLNINMKGAQDGQHIRRANPAEYAPWLGFDVIRQTTVAPEFMENQVFIRDCAKRGINISIGHTQATYEEVQTAITQGAAQATHTFNAMTGIHHRAPGTAGAVLTLDAITCELVADNVHLHPAIVKLVVRAKGSQGVVLITDAIVGTGMPDGQYQFGGQTVTVGYGMATLSDGTLAGSVLTMDRALRNILKATGLTLAEAWPMTSANAARQIGIADRKGKLTVGLDADLVLLDSENEVDLTIVEGRIVYRREKKSVS
ncbi:MAG: N-acetylglucosamine-6-phosphate deacetylase [Chloroflexota bacterium]